MPDRRDERALARLAELLGLYTLAFAQPMFALVQHSPEFFVSRKTPTGAVVIFALTVAFGPPLLALGAERLAEAVRSGWGARLQLDTPRATTAPAAARRPISQRRSIEAGSRVTAHPRAPARNRDFPVTSARPEVASRASA